jgi:polyhydroxybutyrate depolymerase
MRKMIVLGTVIFSVLLGVVFSLPSLGRTVRSVAAKPTRSIHQLEVSDLERNWLEIAPSATTSKATPIVVVLAGVDATHAQEIARDGLLPLVNEGLAELVYPAGIGESWNAGGCCGAAAAQGVNDVAFVKALVATLDPARSRPIDLVGFSDGGRLAYTIACKDPRLFDKYAVIMAMPQPGCVVAQPLTIIQVDGTKDSYIPYAPGDPGSEQPAATTEISRLRASNGCTAEKSISTHGELVLNTWSECADGTRLEFAVYNGGQHLWPEGDRTTPSGASVVWSFLDNGALAHPYFPPSPLCPANWC